MLFRGFILGIFLSVERRYHSPSVSDECDRHRHHRNKRRHRSRSRSRDKHERRHRESQKGPNDEDVPFFMLDSSIRAAMAEREKQRKLQNKLQYKD